MTRLEGKSSGSQLRILILILLCVASRLPQLLVPAVCLDGDECILGLMAKHISEGKEIPLIFYGQKYDFAFIEALFGAAGFKLFGVNALALKMSMLALWSIGVIFFYLGASRILADDRKGFWVTLFFIFAPAWAIYSMKAWGGLLTCFLCTAIIIFVVARPDINLKKWFLLGVIAAVIFISQPIWMAGLLPLLIYRLNGRVLAKRLTSFFAGLILFIVVIILLIRCLGSGSNSYFWSPVVVPHNFLKPFLLLPHYVFVHLTGMYFGHIVYSPDILVSCVSKIWIALMGMGALLQGVRILKRKHNVWASVFFLSTLLTMCVAWLYFSVFFLGYRYLLPLSIFSVLWLGIEFFDWLNDCGRVLKIVSLGAAVLLVMLSACSMIVVRNSELSGTYLDEGKGLTDVAQYLRKRNIRFVYSLQSDLQWQIMFYTEEDVIARSKDLLDRYPAYPRAVDAAFRKGEKVALVGILYDNPKLQLGYQRDGVDTTGVLFVYTKPTKDLLRSYGFALQPEEPHDRFDRGSNVIEPLENNINRRIMNAQVR